MSLRTTSSTTIQRAGKTLAALSIAAVALAGCSSDGSSGGSDGQQSDTSAQQGAASDSSAAAPDTSDIPDPVAVVNGEEISKDEFVTSYESQYQQAAAEAQQTGQAADEDQIKQQVADQLVGNHLLLQAADKAGIKASDADIDATLDELAGQSGLGSGDDLVKALEQQGTSEDEIRENAASQFELTTYIDQEAGIDQPTDDEVKQQYDQLTAQQGSDASQQIGSFEDVKDQLAQQMMAQQRNEAASGIVETLKKDADVQVNL